LYRTALGGERQRANRFAAHRIMPSLRSLPLLLVRSHLSNPDVGSSRKRILGCVTVTMAMETRFRSPPETPMTLLEGSPMYVLAHFVRPNNYDEQGVVSEARGRDFRI